MKPLPYEPPFQLTQSILKLSIQAAELIGRWDGATRPKPKIKLRKENKIRSIQSSLAIEGNTLSLEQVTALLEKKRVIGPRKDILEVQNAILAYDLLPSFTPHSEKDFLKLHASLMKGLIPQSGLYRSGQVGVMKGAKVSHVAPPAKQVPLLMGNLFQWMKGNAFDPLIASCIAHYEIEFIHPFADGNGRIGRLWQALILLKAYPLFEFVPVEEMIRKNQKDYYLALETSDRKGDVAPFVEFMLKCLVKSLEKMLVPTNFEASTSEGRLESARGNFRTKAFSRADYLKFVGQISTATASRDLKQGIDSGTLIGTGEQRMTVYRFKK
jgi:Fic family protein